MARIKKEGLDYFPLSTDFMSERPVRRILKSEGDAALSVLLCAMCHIYAGRGYYIQADDAYCEDLADELYTLDTAQVRHIIDLAARHGLFDERLYRERGVLTSAEIQRQYLFSKRRGANIDPALCLLTPDELESALSATRQKPKFAPEPSKNNEKRTNSTENNEKRPKNDGKTNQSTQSTAQHSTANPLPNVSPETGGNHPKPEGGIGDLGTEPVQQPSEAKPTPVPQASAPSAVTEADLARLVPPADGRRRNLEGLLLNLRQHHVSPQEQLAIVQRSDYGLIGHPVWRGFADLRDTRQHIRLPGRYLLSLCPD